jgi:hypothetical protein
MLLIRGSAIDGHKVDYKSVRTKLGRQGQVKSTEQGSRGYSAQG